MCKPYKQIFDFLETLLWACFFEKKMEKAIKMQSNGKKNNLDRKMTWRVV